MQTTFVVVKVALSFYQELYLVNMYLKKEEKNKDFMISIKQKNKIKNE